MPNGIKYSTGATSTGCLRKGDMLISNNTADTGTSFFTGINPPSGGYTIYLNKASGGPSIYCPTNDTQLIAITNQIAGTSFTTAAQCLNYYVGQSDKLCVNSNYESIVTDGLVLNLDAGFTPSYPTTGSTWYDLSGNGNNGTLVNGPTYSSANGGSIVFDGIDDYGSGSGTILTTQGTLITWFKTSNTYSNNYLLSLPFTSDGSNGFDLGFGGSTTFRGFVVTTDGYRELTYTTTYSDNNWHMGAITYSASNAVLYYDGVARTINTSLFGSLRQTVNGEFNVGRFGSIGAYVAASISNATVYNRALSATEVAQNYYGGPIVTDGLVFAVDAGNLVSYPRTGTTAYSLTGSANGTLTNGTGFSSEDGGTWIFDGVDDYIEFPFETILNDCSIEMWFKATSTRTYQYSLAIRNNGVGNGYSFYLDMNDTDLSSTAQTMWVYWNSGGTPYSVVSKTGTNGNFGDWNDSTWRHYVFTRSTTVNPYTEHYMNGVKLTNVTRDGDQTTQFGNGAGYKLYLGQIGFGALYYPGYQAIVRIYNKSLSSAEVTQNFNAQRSRFGI